MYVYAGVLNYETVYHSSSLFGIWYIFGTWYIFGIWYIFGTWYTRVVELYIKQVTVYVGLSDID